MTDAKTRSKSGKADVATLDLFEPAHEGGGGVGGRGGRGDRNDRNEKGGGGGKPPPPAVTGGEDFIDMAAFAERSYLTYAMSVVRGRAIPNVEDGQKPVQRRILYAMNELGLRQGVQHSKSARIVGEVLGKYHPHGDASTYDALVRMAQDFSLRYPLIDGQGNFGTQDGDPAAAYRYTEARLTPLADLLLSEIDQDTVDFIANYDGRLQEPELLPARLPMLLLNGASGVAVGMACELPPHNMGEVAEAAIQLLKHPKTTPKALLELIQGPDFPGGGQIISPRQAIVEAYTTGRGSLRARCRWKVENLARGQWQVVVYELPPTTSAKRVMEEIEELTNPKVKEKGKVSATQANLRQLVLGGLEKVNDESDKDNKVRLVLEPRSSRQDPDEFMRLVLTHTSLEDNFSVNLVALGLDGRPQRKNIAQLVGEWVEFRVATVTRRTTFRLSQVERRIHILEGRSIVLINIDKVIKLIRGSDEPKPELMKRFRLSDAQAEDILEIRLRQLARLEGIRIETELKALKEERKGLKSLLGSDAEMKKLVGKEIRDDAKQYGDPRRTAIEEAGRAVFERQVVDEPLTVIVSRNMWVRTRQGHGVDLSGLTYKTGDGPHAIFETRSVHNIGLIDSTGRAFSVEAAELPGGGKGDGVPLTSFVDLAPGARLAHVVDAQPGRRYLVATSGGYGFVAKAEELLTRIKAGKTFMTVEQGDEVIRPALVPNEVPNEVPGRPQMAVAFSEKGRMLLFPAEELKELARGRGIMLMGLDDGEKLVAVGFANGDSVTVTGTSRSGKERTVKVSGANLKKHILHRARKGCLLPGKITPIGVQEEK